MEVQGTIYQILEEQTGNSSGGRSWRKKSFIVEVPGNYPKKICFDVWGDNIDGFDLKQGEAVTVGFDLESKEYNGRWFTNAKAWKIQKGAPTATNVSSNSNNEPPKFPDASNNNTANSSPMPSASDEPQNTTTNNMDIEDDLPF